MGLHMGNSANVLYMTKTQKQTKAKMQKKNKETKGQIKKKAKCNMKNDKYRYI